jgi:hypothetical protein
MNETPDPLEAELSGLRPREVSRGLRRRIGQHLADTPSPGAFREMGTGASTTRSRFPFSGRRRWLALAGGLAAACLATILFWWGSGRHVDTDPFVAHPKAVTSKAMPPETRRPPGDSNRMVAWRAARRVLDGAEPPPFTWPLSETPPITVSHSIPPDLLD